MTLRIIGGIFKGRLLKTPQQGKTRPTQSKVREALFNICQQKIEEASFLDLFAGSGAIGIEAISRGAKKAIFVEEDRGALRTIDENLELLQITSAEVLPYSAPKALSLLKKRGETFDIIYADPPYETFTSELFQEILPLLLPDTLLFIEERFHPKAKQRFSIPETFQLKKERRFGETLLLELTLQRGASTSFPAS